MLPLTGTYKVIQLLIQGTLLPPQMQLVLTLFQENLNMKVIVNDNNLLTSIMISLDYISLF